MVEFSEEQLIDAQNKAYLEAGHNAYFGNGFNAGVKFVLDALKNIESSSRVISRFFIFTGKENGEVTKYCVFNQETDEDAIAEIELSKPNFEWRHIETFK
jgi:hypothetical protein